MVKQIIEGVYMLQKTSIKKEKLCETLERIWILWRHLQKGDQESSTRTAVAIGKNKIRAIYSKLKDRGQGQKENELPHR